MKLAKVGIGLGLEVLRSPGIMQIFLKFFRSSYANFFCEHVIMQIFLKFFCEHVMETDHLIGWSNARILKVETNYFKRLTAESWFIHSHPKVLNRSDGESLPVTGPALSHCDRCGGSGPRAP